MVSTYEMLRTFKYDSVGYVMSMAALDSEPHADTIEKIRNILSDRNDAQLAGEFGANGGKLPFGRIVEILTNGNITGDGGGDDSR